MNTIRLTKEFDFETAHALDGYEGACKNIHGHSYHLKVCIKGKVKDDPTASDNGMVLDFSILKAIVKKEVVDRLDHALLLNENSPYRKQINGLEPFEKVLFTPFQPTCENMLIDAVKRVRPLLPKHIELQSMFLRETKNSYAEWHASDND